MSKQDAIDQANYRQAASNAQRKCSNCRFRVTEEGTDNWCELFDFEFTTGFVCDRHEFRDAANRWTPKKIGTTQDNRL